MAQKRSGRIVEDVYETLRERILEGRYSPGYRINQEILAGQLNVSRTPLREALNRLHADGLVVSTANRGMEVSPAHNGRIEECYAIRLLVEPPIIRAVVQDLISDDFELMEDSLKGLEDGTKSIRAYQEEHFRFHSILLDRYPKAIGELVRTQYWEIHRHQRIHFAHPQVPEEFARVDRLFYEASRERDSELASRLMQFHLVDAALGLVWDVDPAHKFDALVTTARGLGIALGGLDHGGNGPPVQIKWADGRLRKMSGVRTARLVVV